MVRYKFRGAQVTGSRQLRNILRRLGIQRGDLVLLHASYRRISYLHLSSQEIIEIILETIGEKGTLAMPSYAWHLDNTCRPWKGYADYFRLRPVFDVQHTVANIGWIPETFRLTKGVKRSLSYWWSICAYGPLAEELTDKQETVLRYYGPGSSFNLMHAHGAKILGLGVTLNTTSLAPIVDHALGDRHPQQIFSDDPQVGVVIDHGNEQLKTRSYWLLPEVVRQIRPSVMFDLSQTLQKATRRSDKGTTIQFAYLFETYYREALKVAEAACEKGSPMPWLENYPMLTR